MKRYFLNLLLILLNFGFCFAEPTFTHYKGVYGLDTNGQQKVHSQTNVIYANEGDAITLHRPDKDTYKAYLRWYNYDTDKAANNISGIGTYTYTTSDGWFIIPNTNAMELTYTMQDSVCRIAADQSAYKDYASFNSSSIIEPTLSKRLIYEMRPAKEIAARIDTCVGNSYLEYHNMMAPIGRQLYIGPNYYFIDQYVMGATYYYQTRSNYYYNSSSPIRMDEESNWIWKVNGATSTFSAVTGRFINVSSNSTGIVTYTLQYKVGNTIYNIAKFDVNYLDVNNVGPLANIANNDVSGMDLIYENTFNFNTPGTTNTTWYTGHIGVDESSYGYFNYDLRSYHYVNGGSDDVYWSEYGFVNRHNSWDNTSLYGYNHGSSNNSSDAKDGYFLYCDGSEIPGQVFDLSVNAELCPGSIMYFSAWVMDLSYAGSDAAAPNIDFVVTGIRDNGDKDELTTFTTGEFGTRASMNGATWFQVLFPIEFTSDVNYKSFKIRIDNKGKSGNGNDFGIDDIRIYHQKAPVTPIQASTYDCPDTQYDTVITYIRADYQSIAANGNPLYYQWRDYNDKPITAIYYNNGNLVSGTYGIIPYPTDAEVAANKCSSLLAFDATYHDTKVAVIKYIDEQISTSTNRPIMYIAQPIYARTNYNYAGYVASSVSGLGDRGNCGTYADLLIVGGTRLTVDGKLVADSVVDACGNRSYKLGIVLIYIDDDLNEQTAQCRADWLIGDSSIVNKNYNLYGATFAEIENAIQDYRTDDPSDKTLKIIKNLLKNGLLKLDTTSTDIQPLKNLDYTAFPVNGSSVNGMPVCLTPRFLHFTPSEQTIDMLVVGDKDDNLPESEMLMPRKVRISNKQKCKGEFVISTYKQGDTLVDYAIDSIILLESTNKKQKSILLYGEYTDDTKNSIRIYGDNLKALKEGYDYTFHIKFKNEETGCNRGYTYFTLRIIPDSVIWQGGDWNIDNNWDTYVPLSETNVILKDGTDYVVSFSENIIYDINFVKNECNNIYVPNDASMYGQEDIVVNGIAYIDIKEYAWKWTITSFPIYGVVTGDLFVSQNESNNPFVVASINQTVGAVAYDRYDYAVYACEYDKSLNKWNAAKYTLDRQLYPGEGTLVGIDCDDNTVNPIIRLPKQDNLYHYWYTNNCFESNNVSISRDANYGKLIYTGDNDFTLKETYDNVYLFGNPTLGYIDLTELVNENSNLLTGNYYLEPNGVDEKPRAISFTNNVYNEANHVLLPPFRGCLLEGKGSSNELQINVYKNSLNKAGRVAKRNDNKHDNDVPTDNNIVNYDNSIKIYDILGRLVGNKDNLEHGKVYIIKNGNKVSKIIF